MLTQKRLVTLLIFVAVVAVAYVVFRRQLTLEWLLAQDSRLRNLVREYPVVSTMLGFFVYVAASLVPGTTGKSIVYGWLFGFWTALVVVNLALTLAAVITFLVIRYIFFEAVHLRLKGLIRRVDAALTRDGAVYLVTLRLLHAPYTLTNYAAGATAVPLSTFWWTTHVGLLPGNVAYVLAGSQLPTLQQLAREGAGTFVDLPLLLALSLTALIPVLARWAVRRWRHVSRGAPDGPHEDSLSDLKPGPTP